METHIVDVAGVIEWWEYTVSHAQLLLRSPKTQVRDSQIDILFKDVQCVHLPTRMEDVSLYESTESSVHVCVAPDEGKKVFLLRGSEAKGCVIAAAVFHHEGAFDYGDRSPLLPEFPPRTPLASS